MTTTTTPVRPTAIELRGVRVHNLRNLDVNIPLRRLTAITGVSGAGKSSLALDTLHVESQRRYLQTFSTYTRQFLERLDRPEVEQLLNLPPAVAVSQRALPRSQRSTVGTLTELTDYLQLLLARCGALRCPQCGQDIRPSTVPDIVQAAQQLPPGTHFLIAFPTPRDGLSDAAWLTRLREDGFVRAQLAGQTVRLEDIQPEQLNGVEQLWIVLDRLEAGKVTQERLTDSVETALAQGGGRVGLLRGGDDLFFDQRWRCPRCGIDFPPLEPRLLSFNDPQGACPACGGTGLTSTGKSRKENSPQECPACHGSRLSDLARLAHLQGQNLADLSRLDLEQLRRWCAELHLLPHCEREARLLLEQMRQRLDSLVMLGLGYLSLERSAASLSTGEGLRLRLNAALCSTLVNALYILEEPTAGLHPSDLDHILQQLLRLRDQGNTVVVIEHEAAIIRAADHVLDLGPGAGEEGGEICYQGPPAGLITAPASLTGQYLGGQKNIITPKRRPLQHGSLRLVHACRHNLQDLTVEFPLGVLCVVTGVSGSGKSTLIQEELYPALVRRKRGSEGQKRIEGEADVYGTGQINEVVLMDQTPLGRSSRSNAATYLRVFDAIREVFAETTEARIRNLDASAFSFNQPGGRCETCEGQGTLTVDMQFLADVSVVCPDCKGTRYRPEVLQIKVRNLNIAEVLELTAREAFRFFRAHPLIERRLKLLLDVGLDYLRLGQAAETLSGGESQRLKLAAQLSSSRKPRGLFLLDEPTVGLHPADVARLLDCFDGLIQTGQSLIVIEHNLDVIRCADHIIDLGPGAGPQGGRIVASGTPEEVAQVTESATGRCLREVLG